MGVSIATAKRLLNGPDLSMERVLEIVDVIGMSFAELLAELSTRSVKYRVYSPAQEAFLADHFSHFAFLRLLQKGFSLEWIAKEFQISRKDMIAYQLDLERYEFIRIDDDGNLHLVTKDVMDWLTNGPMQKKFLPAWIDSIVASFFRRPDFSPEHSAIDITQRRLSKESFRGLSKELDELSRKYKAISQAEQRTRAPEELADYHSLFLLCDWSHDFWCVQPYK